MEPIAGGLFFLFTIVAFIILIMKLFNVMKIGQFYEKEWSVVGFVAELFSFMFILFVVLNDKGANSEYISFLWAHISMLIVIGILFTAEVFLWFLYFIPNKEGKEKYGDRQRLLIDRRK